MSAHTTTFYYTAYSGATRSLQVVFNSATTTADIKRKIEAKERRRLPMGFLKSGASVLAKEELPLVEYNVQPGAMFQLPSNLIGGGDDDNDMEQAAAAYDTSPAKRQKSQQEFRAEAQKVGRLADQLTAILAEAAASPSPSPSASAMERQQMVQEMQRQEMARQAQHARPPKRRRRCRRRWRPAGSFVVADTTTDGNDEAN